jgi:hypothetical protein
VKEIITLQRKGKFTLNFKKPNSIDDKNRFSIFMTNMRTMKMNDEKINLNLNLNIKHKNPKKKHEIKDKNMFNANKNVNKVFL